MFVVVVVVFVVAAVVVFVVVVVVYSDATHTKSPSRDFSVDTRTPTDGQRNGV